MSGTRTRPSPRKGWQLVFLARCAYGVFVACHVGCATLMTETLPPDGEELAARAQDMVPLLDGDGQVLSPLRPPSETAKVSLPEYRVEPPDILTVQAIRLVPKAPYVLQTFDVVLITTDDPQADAVTPGLFQPVQIEPSGTVTLGPALGSVKIAGLTLEEARDAISRRMARDNEGVQVSIQIIQISGVEQIAGEHLVRPDGTISLGIHGGVYVAGMTLDEAREAIESQLGDKLDNPQISVDVFSYNSKFFYVVREGAGFGDEIVRIQVTGNETVLDALAQIGGLDRVASKRIWISRPARPGLGCDQILPIDYQAITKGGSTATNYQLLPGDRVFIAEDRLLAFDNFVGKVTAPFERVFGFLLLGSQTVQNVQRFGGGFNQQF